MAFTDDDLKRLKEIHADNPQLCMAHISREEFTALFARLEAAEEMFSHSLPNKGELCYFCKITYEHATDCPLIAWRKAAGK